MKWWTIPQGLRQCLGEFVSVCREGGERRSVCREGGWRVQSRGEGIAVVYKKKVCECVWVGGGGLIVFNSRKFDVPSVIG